jgi:anthranilate phosphoribosyltransferase
MTEHQQPIARAIAALASSQHLGEDLTTAAFGQLMRGEATAVQAAALLTGLRVKGETAEEVAGAVRALRGAMVQVPIPGDRRIIDTCGTGGGLVSTFNISTAAALVVVGAGVAVAKHGNRSFTSRCGSADVAEALGLPVQLDPRAAASVLQAGGLVFLFAPHYHPAMRFVAPVRRELAIPTVMNVIGPLANPAGVRRQVVGVADAVRGPLLADALCRLGADHALVVHARVGMDEIAPSGPTSVWEVLAHEVRAWTLDPADYGLREDRLEDLAGGDPTQNAMRITRLLADPRSDRVGRATVVLNAGAGLYVAGLAGSLKEGVERAQSALDDGRAAKALERWMEPAHLSTSA